MALDAKELRIDCEIVAIDKQRKSFVHEYGNPATFGELENLARWLNELVEIERRKLNDSAQPDKSA